MALVLKGKVAIVTGASGAIGGAIATQFAAAGATVVAGAYRRAEALVGRTDIEPVQVDVTSEASVAAMFDRVVERHGRVDVLVNSAGIAATSEAVEDADVEQFRRVLDVNVLGTFVCAKHAFRHNARRVINIGSISAAAPRPLSEAYTASKFAVQGLTRSLALDGRARGIAVSVVHPGNVPSDLLSPKQLATRQRLEGLLDADDVARSVLHVASAPDAANVLELTVLPTAQPLVGRG